MFQQQHPRHKETPEQLQERAIAQKQQSGAEQHHVGHFHEEPSREPGECDREFTVRAG